MVYIKNSLITILVLLIISIIFGTLSYFNIFNDKYLRIIQIVSLFITISIESYCLGRKKDKNGYIEGFNNGSITLVLFLILNLLLKRDFSKVKIIIYFVIIILSTFASILGINKKMKD